MKIGIHSTKGSFSDNWIEYCIKQKIDFKEVNCYATDIIDKLEDCQALLWHHSQTNPKDILIAKELLFSLEHSGKSVFPDFKTNWHFDDKLGQKYLLEALKVDLVPSYAFFEKKTAQEWVNGTSFPKVFKLRGGAGSANVRLIKSPKEANRIINKAFGKGFQQYNTVQALKENYRKYKLGKSSLKEVLKGVARIFIHPKFSKVLGRERAYVYFQDFIPENNHDIRVVVIDDKAFAIKRIVRENDFRASGSGEIFYKKELFDDNTIQLSFQIADKLASQCVALDFIYENKKAKLVEISYGFDPKGYTNCTGFWDKDMTWHAGTFNPYGWMIESLIKNADD